MKQLLAIATASLALVALAGAILLVGPKSQTRVLNRPYADVVAYLCGVFKTDLTKTGLHSEVWGPTFLDTTTQYFVETYDFSPNKELRFQARYYQIGGEDNTFTIRRLNERQPKMTVDQVIHFFAVFPKCTGRELKILDTIQKDLENESRTTGRTVSPEAGTSGVQ